MPILENTITDEQRRTLTSFTRTGTHAARAITHAKILLQTDTNGPKHTDEQIAENIAENLEIKKHTVERTRKKFCTQGLDTSMLAKQALRARVGDVAALAGVVARWVLDRCARAVRIDWQFRSVDAQVKLKRLYPVFIV